MLIVKTESRALTLWHYFSAKPIIRKILDEITNCLPPEKYPYHNVFHAHEVAQEALLIALYEDRLNFWELELLAIAAAYHDAGYIRQYKDNETQGAWMAVAAMRESGKFQESEILRVWNAIVGTQMSCDKFGRLIQSTVPGDSIGEYLADADLGNLGRPDFSAKSELLFQELLRNGKIAKDNLAARGKFKEIQLRLFEDHDYFSNVAKELRAPLKQKHLMDLSAEFNLLSRI